MIKFADFNKNNEIHKKGTFIVLIPMYILGLHTLTRVVIYAEFKKI